MLKLESVAILVLKYWPVAIGAQTLVFGDLRAEKLVVGDLGAQACR